MSRWSSIFEGYEVVEKMRDYRYLNGNYIVTSTGGFYNPSIRKTAIHVGEPLVSKFPDSIDLKITNRCSWGCPFCHESSCKTGKSMDIEKTKEILKQLPNVPIEIAIGGGNLFEVPELTLEFLKWIVKDTAFLPRITLNQRDLKRVSENTMFNDIIQLTEGIGISLDKLSLDEIEMDKDDISFFRVDKDTSDEIKCRKYLDSLTKNCSYESVNVYHIIAGVFPVKDLELILKSGRNILILGYKQFGRAKDTSLPEEIKEYERIIKSGSHSGTLSFDNLAIEQLHLKEYIDSRGLQKNFMGEEGMHSMYIDAVTGTYARTSRSETRVSWDDLPLLEFFNRLKDDKYNY